MSLVIRSNSTRPRYYANIPARRPRNLIDSTRPNAGLYWTQWPGTGGAASAGITYNSTGGSYLPTGVTYSVIGLTTETTASTGGASTISMRTSVQWQAGITYLFGVWIQTSLSANITLMLSDATSSPIALSANTWTWVTASLTPKVTTTASPNTATINWVGVRASGSVFQACNPIVALATDYQTGYALTWQDFGDGYNQNASGETGWTWAGTAGNSNSLSPAVTMHPIKIGTSPQQNSLGYFQEFNRLIGPRTIDHALYFSNFPTDPVGFSSWWTDSATLGATPLVTWSPSSGPLSQVLDGSKDSYLTLAVNRVKQAPGTVIVRLAHEFNLHGSVYGTSAETAANFIAGWQYVVNYFSTQGVTNVQWIWGPNIWDGTTTDDPSTYYPGDSYVDYISLDGYMSNNTTSWTTFHDIFISNYTTLCGLTTKPFGICEVGVTSTRTGYDQGVWVDNMWQTIWTSMPRVTFLHWWNRDNYALDSLAGMRVAFAAGANQV